jgi:hypothetical protein
MRWTNSEQQARQTMNNYERLIVTHAIEEIEKLQALVRANGVTFENAGIIGSSTATISHLRIVLDTNPAA